MAERIKINLPLSGWDWAFGIGEAAWAIVDPETKKAHDADAEGEGYSGVLEADSAYYPGLKAGTPIPLEMRGTEKPVADFYGFLRKLPMLAPGETARFARGLGRPPAPGTLPRASAAQGEASICRDCRHRGSKHDLPQPNGLPDTDPDDPSLKHSYCCHGDCALYMDDLTFRRILGCECFGQARTGK